MSKRPSNTGTIFKLPNGRWAAELTYRGRRVRRIRRTQADAAIALDELHAERKRGLLDKDSTVEDVLTAWLDSVSDLRPLTLMNYRNNVRLHVAPKLGHLKVRQLTPQHVDRAVREWEREGASARSVVHYRGSLRAALNNAMRWGIVDRNVATLSRPPALKKREVRPMTLKDARAVLRALEGDRLSALYTVALSRGISRSESLALRWRDVDLELGTIIVQRSVHRVNGEYRFEEPKNDYRRRTFALPSELVDALRTHRARQLEDRLRAGELWQPTHGDLVFTTTTGGPLNGTWVLKHFQKLLRRANLPEMTFHELRHAAVSLMAAQGVPLATAMQIVGHSDPKTTLATYTHVASDAHLDAAERGRALWGNE